MAEFENRKKSDCGKANKQSTQNERNKILTSIESRLYSRFVARLPDIVDGIRKQRAADADEIRKTGTELTELRSSYQRYRDLTAHLDSRVERVRVAMALLADEEEEDIASAFEFLSGIDVEIENPSDIQSEMPLWKMVREVVRQVEELRIVELENVMKALKIKTSRQALESAISAHKRTFAIRRNGREKFVSLKR